MNSPRWERLGEFKAGLCEQPKEVHMRDKKVGKARGAGSFKSW